jgi:hypothetical protein
MPQIKSSLILALAMLSFLGFLSLAGCGDTNSKSNYDPDLGKHPAGWLPAGHAAAARADIDSCRACHGQDFTGGISKVACTLCHLGQFFTGAIGTGPEPGLIVSHFGVHPPEWTIHGDLTYALHGPYVQQHGAAACANAFCHGTDLQGVPLSGPSCSSCHMGGPFSMHPIEWANQINLHGGYVLQHGTFGPPNQGCRNVTCHGAQLQGVLLSGPACNDCHSFATPIPF